MKIALFVFLSLVTLVIVTSADDKKIPEALKGKKGCVCQDRKCTDTSCEDKNCICIIKALKNLQANKDLKYPKKWLEFYLQIVQERCLCIQRCQNICSPRDYIDCTSHAFDVFNCKFQKWLAGIAGDKGYKEFIADIHHVIRACLNKDCKPICSGDNGCRPFLIKPRDCGCTKRCVAAFLKEFSKSLQDPYAQDQVDNLGLYADAYYEQRAACEKLKSESQRDACVRLAEAEITRIFDSTKEALITELGPCTGVGVASAIEQGVGACALEKN